ncbi:MAG: response regulator transcription factor [Proteobacteria bacterium]|nr:MAG: response regulator transcription factor [Pseudomonadota bacterium]
METPKRYTVTLDDDPMMSPIIARTTGIPSLPFATGDALLKRAASLDPVAAFIDVHLGVNLSGLDVIPHLRSIWKYTPIIIITGDDDPMVVGDALAAGANDFIRKPIQAPELSGRLQARLAELNQLRFQTEIVVGDLIFSKADGVVQWHDKRVYLPKLEAKLFLILLENREMIVSKESIKRRVWGELTIASNTLDKRISKLRSFLHELDSHLKIEADYGKGVCLKIEKADEDESSGGDTPMKKSEAS